MKNSYFCLGLAMLCVGAMIFEDDKIYEVALLCCAYISIAAGFICSAIENKGK